MCHRCAIDRCRTVLPYNKELIIIILWYYCVPIFVDVICYFIFGYKQFFFILFLQKKLGPVGPRLQKLEPSMTTSVTLVYILFIIILTPK